jgi:hypothetical protein
MNALAPPPNPDADRGGTPPVVLVVGHAKKAEKNDG